MSYKGFIAELPAGRGGFNGGDNPSLIPITDLIDAEGVVVEDGLLQKEPGAQRWDTGPLPNAPQALGSFANSGAWAGILVTYKSPTAGLFVAQRGTATGTATVTLVLTPTGTIAAGRLAVLTLGHGSNPATVTVTDSKGNTWTADATLADSTLRSVRVFSSVLATQLTGADTITVTFASSVLHAVAAVAEYQFATGGADRTKSGSGSGTAVTVGPTLPLSQVPQLLVLAVVDYTGGVTTYTPTPANGFTLTGTQPSTNGLSLAQAYRVDTTTPTIVGLHDWWPDAATQRLVIAATDGRIYKDDGAGDLDAATLTTGLTIGTRPAWFVEAGKEAAAQNRKLFFFNGVDPLRYLSGNGGAVTLLTAGETPTDWSGTNQPLAGVVHRSRLGAFGNANDPHRLYLSTLAAHQDFKTGSGTDIPYTFSVYPSVGERLVAGAVWNGLLWMAKFPRGIFWLDDADPDPTTWTLQQRTDALGVAASPHAFLPIDNDILFLSADGSFHLLSAVEGGVVRDSDLTVALRLTKWMRTHVNLGRLDQVRSRWYPQKKLALFALPSVSSTTNDLVLKFDWSERTDSALPRFFWSRRDPSDAMALRREADQVARPIVGEGGIVWLLDRATRSRVSKDGATHDSYSGAFQWPHRDFVELEATLGARKKNWDHLELVLTPTTGTMQLEIYLDESATPAQILTVDLTKRRQRLRLTGSSYTISVRAIEPNTVDVNFQVQRALVFFREADEGRL